MLKPLMPAIGHPGQFNGKIGWWFAAGIFAAPRKFFVPREQPSIQQADAELHVSGADPLAVGDGVYAVAGSVSAIPKAAQKLA